MDFKLTNKNKHLIEEIEQKIESMVTYTKLTGQFSALFKKYYNTTNYSHTFEIRKLIETELFGRIHTFDKPAISVTVFELAQFSYVTIHEDPFNINFDDYPQLFSDNHSSKITIGEKNITCSFQTYKELHQYLDTVFPILFNGEKNE